MQALLADNDGIVVDTERWLVTTNTQILKEHYGVDFDPNTRRLFTGMPNIEGIEKLLELHGINPTEEQIEKFDLIRRPMFESWYKDPSYVPGYLGFHEGLKEEFPESKFIVVSGTNPEFYKLMNDKLKVANKFDGVCLSKDVVERHKPKPDVFIYGAGMARAPVKNCATIEDSPLGLASSINAGVVRNIALTRTLDKPDLIEATERTINRKLNKGEVLFIDEFNPDTTEESIRYLKAA